MRVCDSFLDRPRSPTRNVTTAAQWQGSVLVPDNQPVVPRRLVEQSGSKRNGIWANKTTRDPKQPRISGRGADCRMSHQMTRSRAASLKRDVLEHFAKGYYVGSVQHCRHDFKARVVDFGWRCHVLVRRRESMKWLQPVLPQSNGGQPRLPEARPNFPIKSKRQLPESHGVGHHGIEARSVLGTVQGSPLRFARASARPSGLDGACAQPVSWPLRDGQRGMALAWTDLDH